MIAHPIDLRAEVAAAAEAYRDSGNLAALLDRLAALTAGADPEALAAAVEPYIGVAEIAGPVYERIVEARPDDARALVILANAYWLAGRGPDQVAQLATRAIAADPTNRGAWHLWALSESDPRARTGRWQQVVDRFPADDLARATLADNAASLAGAEHDREALALAIRTYEELLATATRPDQRSALERAIATLKAWRL
ncbi:MAG TPA: hypothetical protein VFS05_10625 [Gemmatimonadaceae bacterium]|nr:hypothetical protein [Gemmatimonadaceae bacterium]